MTRRPAALVRRGFTLTEMLVVIAIVVVLAAVVIPIALRFSEGRRVRDAARTVQAAIAGARDRAMGAGFPVGVRFLQESSDPSLVRSMAYIRQPLPATLGKARVELVSGAYRRVLLLSGPNPTQFKLLRSTGSGAGRVYYGNIRFEDSTRYYSFTTTDALLALNPPELLLDEGLPAPTPEAYSGTIPPAYINSTGADYKIPLGSLPLEDSTPIRLPDGVVIDLGTLDGDGNGVVDSAALRLSRIPIDSQSGYFDILFSPTGQVMGNAAVEQFLSLWIREELGGVEPTQVLNAPATQQKRIRMPIRGTHLLMTVFPRTGLIKSVDPLFEDLRNELTGAATPDGFADFTSCFAKARGIANSNY